MAVKLKVLETHEIDIAAETDTVEKIEITRSAGNPADFREEAVKIAEDKLSLSTFELYEKAIILLTDQILIAQKVEVE